MINRLTIHDMAVILAERTGKDKKNIELFLREFIQVVTEKVYADKLVKVKGLGSFKIIPVEQRESIHVNTGERIMIPAHYKFSFHPDKELRDVVNQPFSFFETTELNPGVEFVIPEEDHPVEETEMETAPEKSTEVVTPPEEKQALLPEANNPENEPVERIEEDENLEPDKVELPRQMPEEPVVAKTPASGSLYPLIATIVATILVTAGGIYFYLHHHHNNGTFQKKTENIKNTISSVDNPNPQPAITTQEPVLVTDSILGEDQQETPADQQEKELDPLKAVTETPVPDNLPTEIATVKIEPGSRLTLIALEHYGHKLFWVYIYEYNKDIITDPNNIPVGTVLKLPAKNLYDIDARNRKSLEKAAIRQTEILTGSQ
ncbi:MAG: HU family DNA-binding protein [Tannerellaceae bacterium]|nr:HU family DNA-binding protein [Tannerellaceae bacterium]